MSIVTGVVLCTSATEGTSDEDVNGPSWARVQAWLRDRGFEPLALVDGSFAGTKSPQMIVGGGGYNWFPDAEFVAFVRALPWSSPENVVLVVQPEEGGTAVHRPAVS